MSDNLQLTQSFQEKVYEKIRDSIGDLLSDEDLKKLVDAAVQKAFFEPRVERSGYHDVTKAPWLVEKIEKLLQANVQAAIAEWIEANPEKITEAINEVIAKGMFGLVVSYFENKVQYPLMKFADELRNKGML